MLLATLLLLLGVGLHLLLLLKRAELLLLGLTKLLLWLLRGEILLLLGLLVQVCACA